MQLQVTAEQKKAFEEQAARLNLGPAAYLLFLMTRGGLGSDDASRFDRQVRTVFGKHGELIRRLAK